MSLAVLKVSRSFTRAGDTVRALQDISLTARPGQLICLHGPTGAGKTTLLNLLAGLDRPDTGEISISGVDLGSLRAAARVRLRRQTVGVLTRDALLPDLTTLENVALPLQASGVATAEAFRQSGGLLERLGLGEVAGWRPPLLTAGQRRVVGIARALTGGRRVLLADDPTGALEAGAAREVLHRLRAVCAEGVLVVVGSGDPVCREYADVVCELLNGQLAA